MHRGSPRTRSASSKLTLCFSKFFFAFSGSQVQRTGHPYIQYRIYSCGLCQ